MEEKKFKVIKILDDYAIVITNDYFFRLGDKVKIYSEGDELKDREGNSYGKLKLTKDILTVIVCENNYAICKKIITEKKNRLLPILAQMSENVETETEINVDKSQVEKTIYETSEPIKLGDLAIRL